MEWPWTGRPCGWGGGGGGFEETDQIVWLWRGRPCVVGGGGWRRQTRSCDYGGDGPVGSCGGDGPDSVIMEGAALWGGVCGGDRPDSVTMEGTALCGWGWGVEETDQMVWLWRGRPCGEGGVGVWRRRTRWSCHGRDGPVGGVGGGGEDRPNSVIMEGTALCGGGWGVEETDQMVLPWEGRPCWGGGGGRGWGDRPDGVTMEGTALMGWEKTDQMVWLWRGRPCGGEGEGLCTWTWGPPEWR